MKFVRFDSVGGASGDMILGCLAALGAPLDKISSALEEALPGESFKISLKPHSSHGLSGFRLEVEVLKDSVHERGLHEIEHIIEGAKLPDKVKALATHVFRTLGKAEAKVHDCDAHHIHFHEVGAVDSIVDIVGSCYALHLLDVQGVSFGPLPEGQGTFKCRHGIYPIPAPATAELLKGVKVIVTDEPFEMVTPTGAALLTSLPPAKPSGKALASVFAFGSRKLNGRPNALRATLMEESDEDLEADQPCLLLETNIDDLSPEVSGSLFDRLLSEGALDVWTSPIFMKKQRQGLLLSVLCRLDAKAKLERIVFEESGTFGIRCSALTRSALSRKISKVETKFGPVSIKTGSLHGETVSMKPEYEDCLEIAKCLKVPLKEVLAVATEAARREASK